MIKITTKFLLFISLFCVSSQSMAKQIEYDLNIEYKTVNFTGKDVQAMTINDSVPGPTLSMTEGDEVTIRVHNNMDVETSIHWHGILLPNREDGVPYLNTPPIQPGKTHSFQFPIVQSGTYWYHSHTGLQEQRGLFGAIVIHPKNNPIKADYDHVLILSDWTDENPNEILRTLKRGSDYYALKKNSVQSLWGAIKNGTLSELWQRNLRSIPAQDVSDVAYDVFLNNGKSENSFKVKPGDKVRLRIINAAASTYFYLQFAGGPLQVVAADGIDVTPVPVDRLLMTIAETYDIIVTVPDSGAFEFRATAQDGSGHTALFIGQGERILAPDVPQPNLYKALNFGNLPSPYLLGSKMKGKVLNIQEGRPLAPYSELRSKTSTKLPDNRKVREHIITLTGDMDRYIWMMNGKTLSESDVIPIKKGENVRFVLVNKTMMHHPMHLHGHFFRVINEAGDYSPLKHTVDVPPFSKQIIEFAADEEKDWFFHCHVLYHVKAGMAQVIHYEGTQNDADITAIRKNLYKDPSFAWVDASFLSQMTDGIAIISNSRNSLSATWQWDWEKDYDVELAYDRYLNRLTSIFGGLNTTTDDTRGIAGLRYLLPLRIRTTYSVDTDGKFNISAGRELALTSRTNIFGNIEYDTETKEEWVAGFDYIISRRISFRAQHHSNYGTGAGIAIIF